MVTKAKKKIYISFSIHGTNCFIIAINEKWNPEKLPPAFKQVQSRRPKHDPDKDGLKVEWNGLLNKKTGEPYKSPQMVLARFRQLEQMGFTIIRRDEFVAHHFRNKK